MKRWGKWYILLLLFLLCGCAETEAVPAAAQPVLQETVPTETVPTETVPAETVQTVQPQLSAPPPVPEAQASGVARQSCDRAQIDHSNTADGYVMARFTGECETRLKAILKGPGTTWKYDLPKEGWTVFPLADGSGSYQLGIYENITGSRYALVMSASFEAELTDPFAPFLRPNQYVSYTQDSQTVALGAELTADLEEPLEKVAAVYDYVVGTLTYDFEKAETVESGYLPVLDRVLEEKKGICFDYAALMTAMLRSQEIPCKLVVGYAGSVYHAWISVWTEESGWIDGFLFFDGHSWRRMDPTFASSAGGDPEILEFIENGRYTEKYLY